MVPVCDKRYHIYNRIRHFWAEIKKLWNYPFRANMYKNVHVQVHDVLITWFNCTTLIVHTRSYLHVVNRMIKHI